MIERRAHHSPGIAEPLRSFPRTAALSVAVLVFTWPQFSPAIRGASPLYPLVTALFTLLLVAIVVTWDPPGRPPETGLLWSRAAVLIVAALAACIVLAAAYRWTRVLAWQPYGADMLIVIREATRRLLNGRTPYATYRSYDAPWNMAMPYGPALWAPFVVPQLLRVDFRFVTIIGELCVPLWCGIAAVVESARGSVARAASWLAMLAAVVLALDVQAFTRIGHTPVYWPLFPLFAAVVARQRWVEAACLLGVLVVARSTMVALMPVFVMAVWVADRRKLPLAAAASTAAIGVALAPFIIWDHRAVWENMVLSYPRVMKAAVWPVLARAGAETIGLTEWLLEQHHEALVAPAQITVMLAVYAASWRAVKRGARPLPWMALALLAFSMTTLYPVHYLYYDVLLLLVAATLAETLEGSRAQIAPRPWLLALAALLVLVVGTVRAVAAPFPHAAAAASAADRPLRAGFARAENDGQRSFSWIVGNKATIVLPRASARASTIVLTAQSPIPGAAGQRVTAILNGHLLAQQTVAAGWQQIRFDAPRSTWWVGYNELQLMFSDTVSPRDAGVSDDRRRLALAVSRVEVVPVEK